MKNNCKIAIYSGSIPSTTFIERLISGLSKNGCQVYLFGVFNHPVKYESDVKVIAYRNSKLFKALFLLKYAVLLKLIKPKDKAKLDAILKSKSQFSLLDKVKCYPVLLHKPDIFHIQWAKGLYYWSWLKSFDVKLVLSLRGAHINYSPLANPELASSYKTYFPEVDKFHAVSKAIAKEAEKYGAAPDKIDVIYSGLDQTRFNSKAISKTSKFSIISVGRPHWKKGYHYALDACSILKKKNIAFTYTIVGAKDYLELKYQIQDLNLENHVNLLDSMPIVEVKQIIQSANLFLLPSVEEGIANVVLEAMALRTLVLTTNCGGMEEVIADNVNGFICPVRNPEVMAERIIEIKNLSSKAQQDILDNAQKTINLQHTEKRMVSGMLELYKTLIP